MTYKTPKVAQYQYPLNNRAYGFPRGQKRRIKPWVIACLHISGNKNTAGMPTGIGDGSGTRAEVGYVARAGNPGGNSAHSYVARDGSLIDLIPWKQYAAWNNGDLKRPNTKLASVRKIIKEQARGHNPNEAFWWEVEGTGYPGPKFSLTPDQRETFAWRIAVVSIETKLPISRETVLMHADLNGVDRLNCPFSAASREKQLAAVIDRAKTIRKQLTAKPKPPKPTPPPVTPPEPTLLERVTALEARVAALEAA